MANQNDYRDLEAEANRLEQEQRAAQAQREEADRAAQAEREQQQRRAEQQNMENQFDRLLRHLHSIAHRIDYWQIKRRVHEARLRVWRVKNSVVANLSASQIVVRLFPLALYPAAFGMNCYFLSFLSRYYADELVLGNPLLKQYKAEIVLLSIFLLPLFLLCGDAALQSQTVAARRNSVAACLWFGLAAVVCLLIPSIFIYTAWVNRGVSGGESEMSMNNASLMIKGAVGFVVNALVLLGGQLLHDGKSLLLFLAKQSRLRLLSSWLDFRIRRGRTSLVAAFNAFSRALNARREQTAGEAEPIPAVYIDQPTRRILREQFGYDVVAEPDATNDAAFGSTGANETEEENTAHREPAQNAQRGQNAENNDNAAPDNFAAFGGMAGGEDEVLP